MIFNFLILSDEVDDFRREIKIDSDSTFYDLYKALIDSIGFNDKEMSSFFMCNNEWSKKQEITLVEMDSDSDVDIYVMKETPLIDFIEEEMQKLMFVFDYVNDRALFIKLTEIITGKSLNKPQCTVSIGNPPEQYLEIEEIITTMSNSDMDATFFGDESYNIDELDEDGFDGLEGLDNLNQLSDIEI